MSGRIGPGVVLDGTYRIVRLIGQGGMGEVYEARHARLAGRYAVKVLHHEIRNHPEVLQRFAREAKVTSALRHPGIVQVIDFNTTSGGAPYLVMEFLTGEDLGQVIAREGRLDLERTIDITTQIASALAAAHRRGVIHRDLKPQNIFVVPGEDDDAERAKVLDFGISKIKTVSQKLTGASVVLGTPQFMAPEQAEGGEEVDAAADQFALAAIVYEALTGQPAFNGDTLAAVIYKIVHKDPIPIGKLRPDLPSRVGDVLARAFSKSRADRFSSVTEFARHLRAAGGEAGQTVRRDSDATLIQPRPWSMAEMENSPPAATEVSSGRTLAYGANVARSPSPEPPQENDEPTEITVLDAPVPDWRSTTFRRMTGELLGLRGVFRTRVGRWALGATTLVLVVVIVAVTLRGGRPKASHGGSAARDRTGVGQPALTPVEPAAAIASPAPSVVIPIAAPGPPVADAAGSNAAAADAKAAQSEVGAVAFELASDPSGLAVWIDGQPFPSGESQMRTWARGTLPQGTHKFELIKEGYQSWRKTVEIKRGRPNRFLARLRKEDPADALLRQGPSQPAKDVNGVTAACSITVGARPWVELWLDGVNTHLHTPVASFAVACGTHRLRLRREDLPIDFATEVELQPGQVMKRVFHFDAEGKVVP